MFDSHVESGRYLTVLLTEFKSRENQLQFYTRGYGRCTAHVVPAPRFQGSRSSFQACRFGATLCGGGLVESAVSDRFGHFGRHEPQDVLDLILPSIGDQAAPKDVSGEQRDVRDLQIEFAARLLGPVEHVDRLALVGQRTVGKHARVVFDV